MNFIMQAEVRTHATFLETLNSKYDFEPVKLPGLSRNGPQALVQYCISWAGCIACLRLSPLD